MDSDLAKLSYRDLAERLGISADAARMKAKRKVKAGLWRIIPGNHPSDKVMVELPAADLDERVGGERSEQVSPERSTRTSQPERANADSDRLLDALSEAVSLLRPAQEHIERLKCGRWERRSNWNGRCSILLPWSAKLHRCGDLGGVGANVRLRPIAVTYA